MKTREEYIALIASHAEELQNTFGITSLRLFGSVARNEHHEGSDVDVFVEMPPKFFSSSTSECILGRTSRQPC
ncbi:MAG: nucleotidyltransferase domain-containing protein [Escherichia coli]|nr:nucleotidyltransferase domain-containing protein [Escherichia coli]